VDIERVQPEDTAACAEAAALLTATASVDCPAAVPPTPRGFAADLRHGWDGDAGEAYLARDADGALTGLLKVSLPTYDNTNLAWFDLEIHPDHRGRGYGSELLAYGEKLAGGSRSGSPDGICRRPTRSPGGTAISRSRSR
jgi:GNAT superfamily N-acetyltransferase